MTTETRVNVLDTAEKEMSGMDMAAVSEGHAALPRSNNSDAENFDLVNDHVAAPQEYDFGEVINPAGSTATIKWPNGGGVEDIPVTDLKPAEQDIVSGRIDIGRCMFCGLCAELAPSSPFFMTNEYDGMSGYTRQDAGSMRIGPEISCHLSTKREWTWSSRREPRREDQAREEGSKGSRGLFRSMIRCSVLKK